jgi:clan AA aspartic protease
MVKRNIGQEIVAGLTEIKSWRRGRLRTFPDERLRATITLRNPCNVDLTPFVADAIVDTGRPHLRIPERVATQLKLERFEEREVTTADGIRHLCAYVGPIEMHFGNRGCYTGALVLGDEILLGAVPMEEMDLVVSPATRSVTVNPASPNVPSSIAKNIFVASSLEAAAT